MTTDMDNGCRKTVREPPLDFSSRVKINVSGLYYETMEETLNRFPKTLLGCPEKRREYYNEELREYYFSRHRTAFEAILYYYQSEGRLMRPEEIPLRIFIEELEFFQIEEDAIRLIRDPNGILPSAGKSQGPQNNYQRIIWNTFENADSSRIAFLVSLWSIFTITVSVIIACVETTPPLKCEPIQCREKDTNCDPTECQDSSPSIVTARSVMVYLEFICYSWFITEYAVRFLAAANKLEFVRAPLNVIDLLGIVPAITFFVSGQNDTVMLCVLRVARLFRIFRIFKLSRYSSGLKVLAYTIRASQRELSLMLTAMFMIVILSSSAMYYLEAQVTNTEFSSIPASSWWGIITVTTVGYGDIWPHTGIGKLVGSVVSVLGVLIISLPLVAFSTNFEHYLKLMYQPSKYLSKFESQEVVIEFEEESSVHSNSELMIETPKKDQDPDVINEKLRKALRKLMDQNRQGTLPGSTECHEDGADSSESSSIYKSASQIFHDEPDPSQNISFESTNSSPVQSYVKTIYV